VNIGKNLRIILAATGTSILIAAPAAQAGWCWKKDRDRPSRPETPRVEQPRADVCERYQSVDVDALLSRYGHRLSAAQKAQIINAAKRLIEAKCGGDTETPGNSEETPGGDNSGGAPGYGV
jgi:hypothetical protein